ncbi:unnamed protein product [Prorocentrum cordatum]|uniref:Kinesin-like protein n=1 Tax=Prorocentrum cordatum TaxID=2364126 RepID=A0ABN9SNU9_9DINO|nr:unnamed protein product [Polarella glacialis]
MWKMKVKDFTYAAVQRIEFVNMLTNMKLTPYMHMLHVVRNLFGTGMPIRDARAVLLLCSQRADPGQADRHGRTPLDIARKAGGDPSLLEFLQDGGSGDDAVGKRAALATKILESRFSPREWAADPEQASALPVHARDGPSRGAAEAAGLAEDAARMSAERSKLAEENASLAAEIARLSRELEESRASAKHAAELLEHNKGMLERMKSMAATSATESQTQSDEALQRLKCDLEQERDGFRQRQQALGEERERWRQEKEALEQQLERAVAERHEAERREAARATGELQAKVAKIQEDGAEREQAREEEARRAAERARRAEEEARAVLGEKDAELNNKVAALSQKDEELRKRQQAEEEVRKALNEKESELSKQLEALQALQQQMDQQAAKLSAEVTTTSAELEKARADNRRLDGDLRQKAVENEKVWNQLSELRSQHTQLREEHVSSQLGHQRAEAAWREKEATLEGRVAELEMYARKLEQDIVDANASLKELDGCRERAEFADRMLRPLEQKIEALRQSQNREQALRKRYHNQLQDFKGAIRVYARIRPRIKREMGDAVVCRKLDTDSLELEDPKRLKESRPYSFDSVFDEHSTQEDVFSECKSLVSSAFDGFNVTVFAYGQTGAGKTHTMYGNDADPGLVPRLAGELFSIIDKYSHESHSRVKCSMFELYRDELVDLYRTKAGARGLEIKKDTRGSVYVENASDREVANPPELLKAIEDGMADRHVAATSMNSASSRSHLIFIIVVETTNKATKQVSTGKLTLCDLAGSERVKKSEASGEVLKEAQSINKSLSALGDVIEALTKHSKHVPYRNHKLTQLLSDSLGGNAKTLMFVNCSPVGSNADETAAALGYATRAKMITNKVEKNQDSQEVARLKKVIQVMGSELDQARESGGVEMPPLPA